MNWHSLANCYLVQKLCDVVDFVVKDDPNGTIRALGHFVFFHFTQGKRLGHFCCRYTSIFVEMGAAEKYVKKVCFIFSPQKLQCCSGWLLLSWLWTFVVVYIRICQRLASFSAQLNESLKNLDKLIITINRYPQYIKIQHVYLSLQVILNKTSVTQYNKLTEKMLHLLFCCSEIDYVPTMI